MSRILTEGTELDVCKNCAKFGKVIAKPRPVAPVAQAPKVTPRLPKHEVMELIVEDYGERIKQRREKLGLTQEDLARKLAERSSLLQKIESGHHEPDIALAKKIEHAIGVKLITMHEETHVSGTTPGSIAGFTIGDFIKR